MASHQTITDLYLIRHGQAVSNVEPVVGGMRGDTGLTALGREQAGRLRDRLAASGEIRADVLIASSLPRARETAEIVAPAFGLPIRFDDEVQELRVGEADGMTIEEHKAAHGWVDLEDEPLRPIAPGGEGWGQFVLRASVALERITREHRGKTVVIVTHGGVIDVSFVHFFGMSALRVPPAGFLTRNTSLTQWQEEPHRAGKRWRLVRYNDDAHLADQERGAWLRWEDFDAKAKAERAASEKPAVPVPTEEPPAGA